MLHSKTAGHGSGTKVGFFTVCKTCLYSVVCTFRPAQVMPRHASWSLFFPLLESLIFWVLGLGGFGWHGTFSGV